MEIRLAGQDYTPVRSYYDVHIEDDELMRIIREEVKSEVRNHLRFERETIGKVARSLAREEIEAYMNERSKYH